MSNKLLENLDYETKEILKALSDQYGVDEEVLFKAYVVGSHRTMEMLETIAIAKILKEDFDFKDVKGKFLS